MLSTTALDVEALERAGLPGAETAAWERSFPAPLHSFTADTAAVSAFLTRGLALLRRLPGSSQRSEAERTATDTINAVLTGARESFLRAHAGELYDELTASRTVSLRIERLVDEAAARVPGLTPTQSDLKAERERKLADKEGFELAQGLLLAEVLAVPRAGRHLIQAMLEATPEATERLAQFTATGVADLGPVRVTRRGRAGILELSNPRHLNAEDGLTLGPTEWGVDLILLDPAIDVGVIRGGVVDHPRYDDERVFGSGINLTHLYHGKIDFIWYLVRDLGYVSKLYRGIRRPDAGDADANRAAGPEHDTDVDTIEKLWIAVVQRFAIGGACQLLHVMDHVIATRGSRLYLPARKEGIIPGASNLRLPRSVGDRAARQAILSGREWTAGDADAALLCDEVVDPGEVESALDARIEALTSSGLVNAAANRRALRVGQEPVDLFRRYMATYAREQAHCHLSPALVRNLEEHWDAGRRRL